MLSRDRSVTWISLFRIFLETAPVKIVFLKSQNYRSDFHTKLCKQTPHLKSPFKLNQGQRCIKFNVLRDSPLISSCKSSNIWSIKFGGQGCGYLKFIVTIHMHIYVFFHCQVQLCFQLFVLDYTRLSHRKYLVWTALCFQANCFQAVEPYGDSVNYKKSLCTIRSTL